MNIPNENVAKLVRDGGIEAMDALNAIVEDASPHLSAAEQKELRLAVARTMSSILDNIVNPVLRAFSELDVDEDTWGAIAMARTRSRMARFET